MLTFVDVKFISIARVYREALEDKGLFRSANILQIANVVRRVVLLLFLLCFKTVVRDETSKMFRPFFYSLRKQFKLFARSSRLTVQ